MKLGASLRAIKERWCSRCEYDVFCERTNRGGCMLLLQILNVAAGALMATSFLILTDRVAVVVTFTERAVTLLFMLYSLYIIRVVNRYVREYMQEALG